MAYPYTRSGLAVQKIADDYYVAARGGYVWPNELLNYYQPGQDQDGSWTAINFYDIAGMDQAWENLSISDQYLTAPDLIMPLIRQPNAMPGLISSFMESQTPMPLGRL